VAPLGEDRALAGDLEAAATLVRSGALLDAAGREDLPVLDAAPFPAASAGTAP